MESEPTFCLYCNMEYYSNEKAKHRKYHNKKEIAESKFGHIAMQPEREYIKNFVASNKNNAIGGETLVAYAHWSRSIEKNDYDINHPLFQEYCEFYKKKDTSWLKLNFTEVDMKQYMKEKKN